jgi:hypothetical protein
MARIRSIKPEFPQSESMGNISRDARLTFLQLWTISDDEGRLRGNSRMLASLLFPYDDDAPELIDGWLQELEREGCIVRYKHASQNYIQICNWLIHQKIDKPSKSKIPEFDESSRILSNPSRRIKDQGRDQGSIAPDGAVTSDAETPDVDLLGESENRSVTPLSGGSKEKLKCPIGLIVNAYHDLMPMNPRIKVLNDARKRAIAARWQEAAGLKCKPFGYTTAEEGIDAWRQFFAICAESKFLTGRASAQSGKPPFVADLDFLVSPSGFAKCLENKYHREAE